MNWSIARIWKPRNGERIESSRPIWFRFRVDEALVGREARAAIQALGSHPYHAARWRTAIEARRSDPELAAAVDETLARVPAE